MTPRPALVQAIADRLQADMHTGLPDDAINAA
jgi:hypothetical protein